MADGIGCTCHAYNENECGCGVDWTPQEIYDLRDQLAAVTAELERERMRLAACGVVAMSDTPDSAKAARDMNDDYKSGSCDHVARRVDECISLRAQLAECRKAALLEAAEWFKPKHKYEEMNVGLVQEKLRHMAEGEK